MTISRWDLFGKLYQVHSSFSDSFGKVFAYLKNKNSPTSLNYCGSKEEYYSPRHWKNIGWISLTKTLVPFSIFAFCRTEALSWRGRTNPKTLFKSKCVRNPSSIIQGFENNFGHPSLLFVTVYFSNWTVTGLQPRSSSIPRVTWVFWIIKHQFRNFKSNEINISHLEGLPESI